MFKLFFLLTAVAVISFSANTVTLQNGVDSYTGCEDVTLLKDYTTEAYSWYNAVGAAGVKYKGHPDDAVLIFTDFHC